MKVHLPPKADTQAIAQRLSSGGTVVAVHERVITEPPPPPYTTATLLQDAIPRLGWTAAQVMETAQRLFEQGLITYPRTDSTHIALHARQAGEETARALFGPRALPSGWKRRLLGWKQNEEAEGAHEAIRPTQPSRLPDAVETQQPQDQLLYRLIWQRFIASLMRPAKIRLIEVEVEVP